MNQHEFDEIAQSYIEIDGVEDEVNDRRTK